MWVYQRVISIEFLNIDHPRSCPHQAELQKELQKSQRMETCSCLPGAQLAQLAVKVLAAGDGLGHVELDDLRKGYLETEIIWNQASKYIKLDSETGFGCWSSWYSAFRAASQPCQVAKALGRVTRDRKHAKAAFLGRSYCPGLSWLVILPPCAAMTMPIGEC